MTIFADFGHEDSPWYHMVPSFRHGGAALFGDLVVNPMQPSPRSPSMGTIKICLVVWNHGFYDFPYIGNFMIPTDSIFFRGVQTSNQIFFPSTNGRVMAARVYHIRQARPPRSIFVTLASGLPAAISSSSDVEKPKVHHEKLEKPWNFASVVDDV
jgi:hypothetical protein